MAITKAGWDTAANDGLRGYDLHVVRGGGASPVLTNDVYALDATNTGDTIAALDSALGGGGLPANVSNYLSASFIPRTTATLTGSNYTLDNVSVNKDTGSITATAHVGPGPELKNFILDIIVYVTGGSFSTSIRVHVHNSVTSSWLAPSTLTVRPDTGSIKFSVFVEYDDKVVADVTDNPGITWTPSDLVNIPMDANGYFNPIAAAVSAPGLTAVANLPGYLGGGSTASSNVEVEASWLTGAAKVAELVPGSAGEHLKNKVPNFLIISEGFTTAEKSMFNSYTSQILKKLKTTGAKPWSYIFKSSANLWRLWLPSRDRTSTIMNEYVPMTVAKSYTPGTSGDTPNDPYLTSYSIDEFIPRADNYLNQGEPFKFVGVTGIDYRKVRTSPLNSAGGELYLSQLVEMVGLPTDADLTAALATKIADWAALYSPSPVIANVPADVFILWQQLANRRFFDDHDTSLGFSLGYSPSHSARQSDAGRQIVANTRRINRSDLDVMLNRVKDTSGTVIGDRWAQVGATFGKDYEYIFILSAGGRYAGALHRTDVSGAIRTVSIACATFPKIMVNFTASGRKWALNPPALPPFLDVAVHSTFAHENGHAFGLDDEYGAADYPTAPVDQAAADASATSSFNLQPISELNGSGSIDADLIKWRWPRIQNAGVLTTNPAPGGGNHTITVGTGQAIKFKTGQTVHLRKPDLPNAGPGAGPQLPVATYSGPLSVVSSNKDNSIVVSGALTPGDYPLNSIIFQPVPDPDGGVADYAELLSRVSRLAITSQNRANFLMSENPTDFAGNEEQKPANANLPAGLKKPKIKRYMVGLYEGGEEWRTNIMHPTGDCLMRIKSDGTVRDFCPVCAYALVDQIDPSLHIKLDKWYKKRYPKV